MDIRHNNAEFAEALGPLFRLWADTEDEGRECVWEDLIDVGPAEAARQLAATEVLLEGLETGAQTAVGALAGSFITDAEVLAGRAREIAETYAALEGTE